MSYVINPVEVNTSICEALGLDPNRVESLAFQFEVKQVPRVTVTFYPTSDEVKKIGDVVKRYALMELK